MTVAIRVDSAPALGTGHVVRCLALADALAQKGESCRFVAASLSDALADAVHAAGHALAWIQSHDWTLPVAGQCWSDDRQIADAEATLQTSEGANWLVVDHYGLGRAWETHVRAACHRLLVIDDLGRDHRCDLLLDQTAHRNPAERYRHSEAGQLLLGPRHALLRPAFAAAHAGARVRKGPVQRIFVMMSGSDPGDATSLALDAVERAGLASVAVDIVVGSLHPRLDALRVRASTHPGWTLHVDSGRVPELMTAADLAIGAGGTATWERCALGLPTLAIEIADNQRELLREGARQGLFHAVPGLPDAGRIASHLSVLAEAEGLRTHFSQQGLAAVDGKGAVRVAAAMGGTDIQVRQAVADDCDSLHAWRNRPETRTTARNAAPIPLAAHRAWFAQTIASDRHFLLVGERASGPVGVVRFDKMQPDSVEVSIYLAPGARQGDGTPLLLAGESWLKAAAPDIRYVTAEILPGNRRSEDLFARAGYRLARSVHVKELAS